MPVCPFDPPHTDVKRHAASGVIFTGLAQAIKLATQFVSVVVMARLLDPSDFGLVAKVSPIYALAILFHDLGLSQSTMQKPELTADEVNSFFWINVGAGLILSSALIACSPLIARFYGDPRTIGLTIAMALLLFIGGLGNQHGAIMARRMEFRAQATLNTISSLAALAGAVGWAVVFGGYWAIYAGMAVGTLLPVIGVWICIGWRPSRPALAPDTLPMLKYGLGITTANFTNFLVQSLNSVVIGRVLGDRPLGLYDRASRLLSTPLSQLIFPISSAVVPILYRLHDDDDRYRRTFLRTVGSLTLLISPGVVWAIVMADHLVPVLLGAKWTEAIPLFAALSFAALPQLVNGTANWLFMTQRRSAALARWTMFSGVISVAALLSGLPFGIKGVAVASVIAQLLRTPALWWYACLTGPVKVKNVIAEVIPQTIGSLVAFIVLQVLINSRFLLLWPLLIGGVLLSYAVACTTVAMFPSGRISIKRDLDFARFVFIQCWTSLRRMSVTFYE